MGLSLNDNLKIGSGIKAFTVSLGDGIGNRAQIATNEAKSVTLRLPNNTERENDGICYYGGASSATDTNFATLGPNESYAADVDNSDAFWVYGSTSGLTLEVSIIQH